MNFIENVGYNAGSGDITSIILIIVWFIVMGIILVYGRYKIKGIYKSAGLESDK
jgi:hypothetical protein